MATVNATDKLAFSVTDLAKAYGVSPGLIRLEIARGRLRVARIGSRIVIPVEAVTDWLTAAKREPHPAGVDRTGHNRIRPTNRIVLKTARGSEQADA